MEEKKILEEIKGQNKKIIDLIVRQTIANNDRFGRVDDHLDRIDGRLEQIDNRFEQIDNRFEQIDSRFEQIDIRFNRVESAIVDTRKVVEHKTKEIKDILNMAITNHEVRIRRLEAKTGA